MWANVPMRVHRTEEEDLGTRRRKFLVTADGHAFVDLTPFGGDIPSKEEFLEWANRVAQADNELKFGMINSEPRIVMNVSEVPPPDRSPVPTGKRAMDLED